MFQHWCSFHNQKGLPTQEDFLQINHGYSYCILGMSISAICSILQPTEQAGASSASIVWQLLKGVFRRNPPARVWAEIWDVKKVIYLLHSWGKPGTLNYTNLTLKMVMIMALTTVKGTLDLNLLRITPRAMQVSADLVTFQPVFDAQNAWPGHP